MKFDIKKLEKYYNRPSFNFLAYQGFLLSLNMSCCFMASLYLSIANHKTFEDVVSLFILWVVIIFPYVTFFSFIIYTIFSSKNKKPLLFSLPNILFNTLFFLSGNAFFINEFITYLRSGGYTVLLFFTFFTIPFIPITTILFTLLPYLAIRHKEKKHNLTIENPPFLRNKYIHYATLIGTALYVLTNIVFLYITATFFICRI